MTSENSVPLRRSRGMRDLLPGDMRSFRRIEDAFRLAAGRWGYEEVRTPTLETYSLFTVAGGLTPDALSRVYTFLDWDGWSGERLVVRPDSTIPVARAAAEADLPLPARLFYVQSRFLFSGTEEAEHWQCGMELLDAPLTAGDLEVAAVACEALETLGLQPVVRLSHAALASALETGPRPDQDSKVAAGLASLREAAGRPSEGAALARNLVAVARAAAPELVPALEELATVAGALAESGRHVIVDPNMPVDFEYYTGVVMELEQEGEPVGAGGRYTPGWSGLTHTACGCALSIAAITPFLAPAEANGARVGVVVESVDQMASAIRIAHELHDAGVTASLARPHPGDPTIRVSADGLALEVGERRQRVADVAALISLLRGTA